MNQANPYLHFPGHTEEAFEFYCEVFGVELMHLLRFRDFPGNPMGLNEEELDLVAHVALPLGEQTLMGTDHVSSSPEPLVAGNNISVALETDTMAEADGIFRSLSKEGKVTMPLQPTDWAEAYGSLIDRFGVQWMVMFPGDVRFLDGT